MTKLAIKPLSVTLWEVTAVVEWQEAMPTTGEVLRTRTREYGEAVVSLGEGQEGIPMTVVHVERDMVRKTAKAKLGRALEAPLRNAHDYLCLLDILEAGACEIDLTEREQEPELPFPGKGDFHD
jgi:hypothetical protein